MTANVAAPVLALTLVAMLAQGSVATAEDRPQAAPPGYTLDCRFFHGQAFNKPEDHYLVRIARICSLLSDYKSAVIEENSRRFRSEEPAAPSLQTRVRPLPRTSETGGFLIAKSIGLIDALAAMDAERPAGSFPNEPD
ncbi:MAG: hypothetical protein AAF074_14740 [Pseudomonadota bacterium]